MFTDHIVERIVTQAKSYNQRKSRWPTPRTLWTLLHRSIPLETVEKVLDTLITSGGSPEALQSLIEASVKKIRSSNSPPPISLNSRKPASLPAVPEFPGRHYDWGNYPKINPPLLIISDLHVPFHDPRWIERVANFALSKGVYRMLIAGDLIDAKGIATWPAETKHTLEDELQLLRDILNVLLESFNLYIFPGNHDDRVSRRLDRELTVWKVIEWVCPEAIVYRHHHAYVGDKWLISHPGSYSRISGQPGHQLVAKFQRNVAIAHTHKWTWTRDVSGRHWVIEMGGCYDASTFDYIHRELRTFPFPQQGALLIDSEERPTLLHPEMVF